MNVSLHIALAYTLARQRLPEVHKIWISVSFRIGAQLPNSLMVASVQRAGELDMVLRCMEDDFKLPTDNEFGLDAMAFNYQIALSEFWVMQAYDVLRCLMEIKRPSGAPDPELVQLERDFRLIRVPLTKYQLADERKLKAPLTMACSLRAGESEDAREFRTYALGDPRRSHIMPSGISELGSIQWLALDVVAETETWHDRRSLSDRVLKYFGDHISQ